MGPAAANFWQRYLDTLPVEFTSLGMPLPKVGDLGIVLLGDGSPVALIELTSVRHLAFQAVNAAFAAEEGEGDGSLAWWQTAHRGSFGRIAAQNGAQFDEAT